MKMIINFLCAVLLFGIIPNHNAKANLLDSKKVIIQEEKEMTQTYKVQVSMNQAHIVESGFVWKQGDFGFNIEIEVLDFDTTGATPQIIFRKSTGAVEATEITRADNKFTYAIRGTELDTPGPCVCDLKLNDSTTKRVSTASFKYFVIPDTMDGLEQEASSYSDTIEQIAEELTENVNIALAAAVSEVRSETDQNGNVLNTFLYDDSLLFSDYVTEHLGFLKDDGTYGSTTTAHSKQTAKIPCRPGYVFSYKGRGEFSAVSALFYNNNTIIGSSIANSKNAYVDITVPENANYVLFSSYELNGTDITLSAKLKNPAMMPLTASGFEETYGVAFKERIKAAVITVLSFFDNDFSSIISSAEEKAGYLKTDGTFYPDQSLHCKITDKIPCIPGMIFAYKGVGNYSAASAVFYNDDTVIGYSQKNTPSEYSYIAIPENANSVVFSSYASANSTIVLDITLVEPNYDADIKTLKEYVDAKNNQHFTESPNKINPDELFNGYIIPASPSGIANNSYRSSGHILIEEAGDYVLHINGANQLGSYAGYLYVYGADKQYENYIAGTSLSGGWYKYTLTSAHVGKYIRVTNGNTSVSDFYFGRGSAALETVPGYGFDISKYGSIDWSQVKNAPGNEDYDYKSSLTGKVWYCIGDSATHGDFTGIIQPPLPDGKYAGELPVYPFYIGNRTGIEVHNLAVNGAILATKSGGSMYQWTADNHYKLVGEDADYITIWIGANDMWQNVPIGTIDSDDVSTFYGAYNTVLQYYIENRPNAKIGIVASYWCTENYVTAVKNIGAKYGVPVLNFYDDPSLPVSVGSQRPDVSNEIKTLRDTQYRVSQTNAHGSAKFHELESYFIEEWLKTL